MTWRRGDRVFHPLWGSGVVEAKRVLDHVRVVFEGDTADYRTVRGVELRSVDDIEAEVEAQAAARREAAEEARRIAEAPPPPRPPRDPFPLPPDYTSSAPLPAVDAWQTIEALRLGVVPARGVRDYTVARDEELANVASVLDRHAGCRVVWGDYGTGKTHLLEATEQLGLEKGFAVSRVTLDPREQALHHPVRLWRAIASSIRTTDQTSQGFEGVLDKLVDSPDHYAPRGLRYSRFLSPYLHTLRHGNLEHIGWLRDYVRGDNIGADEVNAVLGRLRWQGDRVLRMSDFRTYGRMYVHLVGTLACWVRDAGYRGLLLLFDEVERVDALATADQDYAVEVLKHYASVTMNPSDLAFDPESLYKGGQEVHRGLPLRFEPHQPLVAVFSLTPLEEIEERFRTLTHSHAYDIRLGPLEHRLLPELVARMADLYRQAYPGYSITQARLQELGQELDHGLHGDEETFRAAVRATVFLLDQDRLRPAGAVPA